MNVLIKKKDFHTNRLKKRRLKDQKPVIEGFLSWIKQVTPGSNGKLKKAITYILNQQDDLMTYLEDGRCSLSNNLSENSIRPITVGRKNWLFLTQPKVQEQTLFRWLASNSLSRSLEQTRSRIV